MYIWRFLYRSYRKASYCLVNKCPGFVISYMYAWGAWFRRFVHVYSNVLHPRLCAMKPLGYWLPCTNSMLGECSYDTSSSNILTSWYGNFLRLAIVRGIQLSPEVVAPIQFKAHNDAVSLQSCEFAITGPAHVHRHESKNRASSICRYHNVAFHGWLIPSFLQFFVAIIILRYLCHPPLTCHSSVKRRLL